MWTYVATSAHFNGRWPMANRPVKPVPTATATRPGPAMSTSVPIAAAVTIGWRRLGMSTPGPSPMVEVRSAARHSCTQTSG